MTTDNTPETSSGVITSDTGFRTFTRHWGKTKTPLSLAEERQEAGIYVAVVMPIHNDPFSIGRNVRTLAPLLEPIGQHEYKFGSSERRGSRPTRPTRNPVQKSPIDDLIVLVDRSDDETAAAAREGGAQVFLTDDAVNAFGQYFPDQRGKGSVLALAGIAALERANRRGYQPENVVIVFLDGNVHPDSLTPDHVVRLASALIEAPDVKLVFSASERVRIVQEGMKVDPATLVSIDPKSEITFPDRNGIFTTDAARSAKQYVEPTIQEIPALRPLAEVRNPSNGEYAVRGEVFMQIPLGPGYTVEMTMLGYVVQHGGGISRMAQAYVPVRYKLQSQPDHAVDGAVRGGILRQGVTIRSTLQDQYGLTPDDPAMVETPLPPIGELYHHLTPWQEVARASQRAGLSDPPTARSPRLSRELVAGDPHAIISAGLAQILSESAVHLNGKSGLATGHSLTLNHS